MILVQILESPPRNSYLTGPGQTNRVGMGTSYEAASAHSYFGSHDRALESIAAECNSDTTLSNIISDYDEVAEHKNIVDGNVADHNNIVSGHEKIVDGEVADHNNSVSGHEKIVDGEVAGRQNIITDGKVADDKNNVDEEVAGHKDIVDSESIFNEDNRDGYINELILNSRALREVDNITLNWKYKTNGRRELCSHHH